MTDKDKDHDKDKSAAPPPPPTAARTTTPTPAPASAALPPEAYMTEQEKAAMAAGGPGSRVPYPTEDTPAARDSRKETR